MASNDLRDIFRAACDILQDEGYDARFRPDYSGRAMFKHTTPAIVTDAPAVYVGAAVYAAAIDVRSDECWAWDAVPGRQDQMGLQRVYY